MMYLGARTKRFCAALTLLGLHALVFVPAHAQDIAFDIPAQRLARALQALASQADLQILFTAEAVDARRAPALNGRMTAGQALDTLLEGTGLEHVKDGDTVVVRRCIADTAPDLPAPTRTADSAFLGETLVTGTLIRGATGASPLIVIDRAEIERAGYSTTRQLLAALPQNFGGGDNEGTSASPGGSPLNVALGSSINLRGLGSDASLVLIDGHRIAPAAFGQFVDISLIPLSAVERIEILADGASATYGSDAVGGVVNFILREAVDFGDTAVRAGQASEGELGEVHFSQTLGSAGADTRTLLLYDYTDRSNLDAADRDYTADVRGPFDLLPAQKTHSLLARASSPAGERTTVSATALASRRDAHWRVFNSLTGAPTFFPAHTRQLSAALGADIALSGSWRAQLDASYSRNDTERDVVTNSLASAERNALDLLALDATADGAPARWRGGELELALGLHGRRERYTQGGNSRFGSEREVAAAFGELNVPFGARLDLSLAARYEHSSDYGDITIPKLGVLWRASDDLRLRGTYGRSFRAPALGEFDDSNASALLYDFDDPTAPDGTTLALVLSGNNPVLEPEEASTWTLGLDWQAPVAGALGLGITYFNTAFSHRIVAPLPGVEVLAIFANASQYATLIARDPDPARVREYAARAAFVNAYGTFAPEEVEALIDRRLQNISLTDLSGVDLIGAYQLPGKSSEWTLELNASALLEYTEALTRDAPAQDVVDTAYHPGDFRLRGGVIWRRNGWGASAFVNYLDDATDNTATPHQPIGSWTTLDFQLDYELPALNTAFDNLRFALSITNALNADPPRLASPAASVPLGFDPTNASAVGRFVSLALAKSW